MPFRHSFRSGPNVLEAVDKVFGRPQAFSGLSADNVGTVHEALPNAAPGVVEIWETTKPEDKRELEAWDAPFDDLTETQPAGAARDENRPQRQALDPARRAGGGDVLVLVRQRGPLFEAIIRALKDARHRRSPVPTGWY